MLGAESNKRKSYGACCDRTWSGVTAEKITQHIKASCAVAVTLAGSKVLTVIQDPTSMLNKAKHF